MSGKKIGERLSRIIPLSSHDIEEILSQQGVSGRRFGEIAIQLGLCQPKDVVEAWGSQLEEAPQRVDLENYGIDQQALNRISREQAMKFHIMPLRVLDDGLVVAIDEAAYADAARRLPPTLNLKLQFVLCTHGQISKALREHYPLAA